MLKGIPPVLSPELLKVLAEMGHGDTLVIGDANFAAASMAKDSILIRCDGVKATDLMDAILALLPLDDFVDDPVLIMDKDARHADLECPVWDQFKAIVAKHDPRGADACAMIPRGKFYTMAKNAYAVVATTETAFYACSIVKIGCFEGVPVRKRTEKQKKPHPDFIKWRLTFGTAAIFRFFRNDVPL